MTRHLWTIDSVHSEVRFKIRHMMITTVTGSFEKYTATLSSPGPEFQDAEIAFEAEAASVYTRNKERDDKLRGEEFLAAERFPTITFRSTNIRFADDGHFLLTGEFTLRGVCRKIQLNGKYTGTVVDIWGQTRAGFELNGLISRKDFGIVWNEYSETGVVALADEVELQMQLQMVRH